MGLILPDNLNDWQVVGAVGGILGLLWLGSLVVKKFVLGFWGIGLLLIIALVAVAGFLMYDTLSYFCKLGEVQRITIAGIIVILVYL